MLNMDMNQPVNIATGDLTWQPSPRTGVWRKPLAREDVERGHATSLVRFDAGSQFSAHGHPLGEEILVLEGVFSDHTGDFDRGSYFRNPPGFDHAPFSAEGCTILVKLHQFQPGDTSRVWNNYLRPAGANLWQQWGDAQWFQLHQFDTETVGLARSSGVSAPIENAQGGIEIYVLKGTVIRNETQFSAGTWLREPSLNVNSTVLAPESLIWIKTGHL